MKKNAFTLIEIIVVITILSTLMVLGFMQLSSINNEVNAKNEIVATADIIKVMEDYILTKEVKLTNPAPLYISVNELINQGLFSEDINEQLNSIFNQVERKTYFVKVVKEDQKIKYSVLTAEGLKNNIGNLVKAYFVTKNGNFSNNIEVKYNAEKIVSFTFKYSSNIYDVVLKSIKYTLKHQDTGTVTGPIIVADVKKDASSGYYYINLKNKVAPSVYDLKMTLETELETAPVEINATYESIGSNIDIYDFYFYGWDTIGGQHWSCSVVNGQYVSGGEIVTIGTNERQVDILVSHSGIVVQAPTLIADWTDGDGNTAFYEGKPLKVKRDDI